jgi:tRNA threonylcarbamoyladenosine biosynthesis protein TsaB
VREGASDSGRLSVDSVLTVALETSGLIGSIAVLRGEQLLGECAIGDGRRRHASTLVSQLDELLKSLGIAPRDVGHVAVSVGPGSFTGLRVGVVAAKTWGFVMGCRLTAVGTFEAIAFGLPVTAASAWVIDDALRGDVFVQRFEAAGGEWTASSSPRLLSMEDWLAATSRGDVVTGPAVEKWTEQLMARGLVVPPAEYHRPTAAGVGRCGLRRVRRGELADPFTLAPLYIRRSAAEEKLDAQTAERTGT